MYTGTIKSLTDKGFGFIEAKEVSEKDIFFHASALQGVEFNELRGGETVSFETEQGDRGLKAINVSLA